MKRCMNCNSLIEENLSVCSYCGSTLENESSPGFDNMNPYPQQAKTNGFAIASMVLGIVAVPLVCCCYIGVIPAILAIIFGAVGKNQINNTFGAEKGNGMALAGIILGISTLVISIVLLIVSLANGYGFWNGFWNEFQREFERNYRNYSY